MELKYICYHCGRRFKKKWHLGRHVRKVHLKLPDDVPVKTNQCLLCEHLVRTRACLLDHYVQRHDVKMKHESFHFRDFRDFNEWKFNLAKIGIANFVKTTVKRSGDAMKVHYRCERDRKGPIRNGVCPASMSAQVDGGGVTVDMVSSHLCRPAPRWCLSDDERRAVAHKLANKVSVPRIVEDVMDCVSTNECVRSFTRKDLKNIQLEYDCMKAGADGEKNDPASLEGWARHMKDLSNMVRHFKAAGAADPTYKSLRTEDTFMVLANDVQIEVLRRYGPKVVCLDSGRRKPVLTDGLVVTTVLTVDGLSQGFPCAFLVSSTSDPVTLRVFFNVLKVLVGTPITTEALLADLSTKQVAAWTSVMGDPVKRYYSSWQVDTAWRKSLNRVKHIERRLETYKVLRKLLTERNKENFLWDLNNFLADDGLDRDLTSFKVYFSARFCKNPDNWAHCYRNPLESSTNIHLEQMEKTISYIFFRGKKFVRLDTLLLVFIRYIRDHVYYKLICSVTEKWTLGSMAVAPGHEWASRIQDFVVKRFANGNWSIFSVDGRAICSIVRSSSGLCSCLLKCVPCNICIHSFKCSCPDSVIEWNMCIHVHFLVIFLSGKTAGNGLNNGAFAITMDNHPDAKYNQIHSAFTGLIMSENTNLDIALVKPDPIEPPAEWDDEDFFDEAPESELVAIDNESSSEISVENEPVLKAKKRRKPGAIPLSYSRVLFCDELPESRDRNEGECKGSAVASTDPLASEKPLSKRPKSATMSKAKKSLAKCLKARADLRRETESQVPQQAQTPTVLGTLTIPAQPLVQPVLGKLRIPAGDQTPSQEAIPVSAPELFPTPRILGAFTLQGPPVPPLTQKASPTVLGTITIPNSGLRPPSEPPGIIPLQRPRPTVLGTITLPNNNQAAPQALIGTITIPDTRQQTPSTAAAPNPKPVPTVLGTIRIPTKQSGTPTVLGTFTLPTSNPVTVPAANRAVTVSTPSRRPPPTVLGTIRIPTATQSSGPTVLGTFTIPTANPVTTSSGNIAVSVSTPRQKPPPLTITMTKSVASPTALGTINVSTPDQASKTVETVAGAGPGLVPTVLGTITIPRTYSRLPKVQTPTTMPPLTMKTPSQASDTVKISNENKKPTSPLPAPKPNSTSRTTKFATAPRIFSNRRGREIPTGCTCQGKRARPAVLSRGTSTRSLSPSQDQLDASSASMKSSSSPAASRDPPTSQPSPRPSAAPLGTLPIPKLKLHESYTFVIPEPIRGLNNFARDPLSYKLESEVDIPGGDNPIKEEVDTPGSDADNPIKEELTKPASDADNYIKQEPESDHPGLALALKKDKIFQKCHEILTLVEDEEEADILMKAILDAKVLIASKQSSVNCETKIKSEDDDCEDYKDCNLFD